jgi:hypothetical protein
LNDLQSLPEGSFSSVFHEKNSNPENGLGWLKIIKRIQIHFRQNSGF